MERPSQTSLYCVNSISSCFEIVRAHQQDVKFTFIPSFARTVYLQKQSTDELAKEVSEVLSCLLSCCGGLSI